MLKSLLFFSIIFFPFLAKTQADYRLETVLQKGHAKYMTCYAFSQKGDYVLTGGYDNSAILWEFSTGKQIRIFNRHSEPLVSVQLFDNDQKVMTAGADNKIIFYNLFNGEVLNQLKLEGIKLAEAYVDEFHQVLVVQDTRDGIFIYNLKTNKLIGEFQKDYGVSHKRNLLHPKNPWILSKIDYQSVGVIDFNTKDTVLLLPFDKAYQMGFSDNGEFVLLSSTKLFAQSFEVTKGKLMATFEKGDEKCDGCNTLFSIHPTKPIVLTASSKVPPTLFDITSGKEIRSLQMEAERPKFLSFSPDGAYVLIGLQDKIRFFDSDKGKLLIEIEGPYLDYLSYDFHPTSQEIILPGKDNALNVVHPEKGKNRVIGGFMNGLSSTNLRFSYENWTEKSILKYLTYKKPIAVNASKNQIALGYIDSVALIIDFNTGRTIHTLKGHHAVVLDVIYHPTENWLVTASADRSIIIWDIMTGKEIRRLKGHRELVFDIAFDSSGRYLISSSWDGTMIVWDLQTEVFQRIDFNNASPYISRFLPNDMYILSSDLGNGLNLWEPDTRQLAHNFVGHTNLVGGLDFLSSSEWLATASWDGSVKIWNYKNRSIVGKHYLHQAPVYSVLFSKTESIVFSGGGDNSIIAYNYETKKKEYDLIGHSAAIVELAWFSSNILVSRDADGILKVWDLSVKKELFTRIQLNENDWLVTQPDGYFDGSKNALNLVNYVSGTSVLPVGSLFKKFHMPNLQREINQGKSFGADNNIKTYLEEAPSLEINIVESGKRSVLPEVDSIYEWKSSKIEIELLLNQEIKSNGEIRIYNNGKLILSDPIGENIAFRGDPKKRTYSIDLNDGQNNVSAVVVNEKGISSSETGIKVYHNGEKSKVDLFIFTIGINTYKNPSYNLSFAVDDAQAFSEILEKGSDSLFNSVQAFHLLNEEAIKGNIIAKFEKIKELIGPEDVFVFYYAGHGVMSYPKSGEGDFFIVTHDIINLYGGHDELLSQAFSASELLKQSMEINAQKQLFILDACHSGGALNSFATRGDGRERAIAQLARSTGTFFLSASQDAQYANEAGDLKHGLFTYALMEVLSGEYGNNGDHQITVNELKGYVESRVPELSEEYHGSPQYPTSYSFGQDFPVVIVK